MADETITRIRKGQVEDTPKEVTSQIVAWIALCDDAYDVAQRHNYGKFLCAIPHRRL